MESINFSNNWNNKLNCKYFTTIRKHIPGRFKVWQKVNILLHDKWKGQALIEDVRVLKMGTLNEWHCGIDTGYSVDKTRALLQRFYGEDFNLHSKVDFVLLRFL
jgi:hypothetical protein